MKSKIYILIEENCYMKTNILKFVFIFYLEKTLTLKTITLKFIFIFQLKITITTNNYF